MFLGKESHENERFCKIWGSYCDSFQNGGLWSYGSEKPVFYMTYHYKNNIYHKIIHFNTYFFIFDKAGDDPTPTGIKVANVDVKLFLSALTDSTDFSGLGDGDTFEIFIFFVALVCV